VNPERSASGIVLETRNLRKSFFKGHESLEVLKGVELRVASGEQVAIMGASGAGKSTLLHILGTLDGPTQGEVLYFGQPPPLGADPSLSLFRNKNIGFVFQFHHLLPEFTALENVMLPCRISGEPLERCRREATEILEKLGLRERLQHRPGELSGGEQQRVAIARALVQKPPFLIADEPTGNLDQINGERIYHLLLELNREMNVTVILATHNKDLAARMDRCLILADGQLTPVDAR
jgi:lipoprotein-releasing system ATP-binding protein